MSACKPTILPIVLSAVPVLLSAPAVFLWFNTIAPLKALFANKLSIKKSPTRSRERFEFRQARITKEEEAKEAKRLARKKAAEEAKKKLAEQKSTGVKSDTSTSDPVAEAIAKAKAKQLTPEEEQAKLERRPQQRHQSGRKAETETARSGRVTSGENHRPTETGRVKTE